MAHTLEDIDLIIARLGYTPAQQDLARHQILGLLKDVNKEHYQDAKTRVSIMNKTAQTLMIINLILENQALAAIAITAVNKDIADRLQAKDNILEIKE